MQHFYRYLRPMSYDFKRSAISISPLGGACLRINDEGFNVGCKIASVSFALCADTDVFNKDTAKKIADARSLTGAVYVLPLADLTALTIVNALVDHYQQFKFEHLSHREIYENAELQRFCEKAIKICSSIRAAEQLASMDKDTIEALKLKDLYEPGRNEI